VVALKTISVAAAGEAELTRFRREAEAVARLQHPNIVQVHEVGEAAGGPFFSMEFVAGGTLVQRLAGTPQPARAAAALVETLARAIHAAHQQGIIHRDLKPANVLLTADGTPKISDFGLAKRLVTADTPPGEAGPTRTGEILGTPSYMAPEQATGRAAVITPATDVYALGAILYECLTGRPPFLAETPLETVLQVQLQEPVPPRRLQPKVPKDLETICLKCLHKEPHRRYADADGLAEDLRRFQAGETIRARPVGPLGRLGRWCRRRPLVASLLAGVALLVAGHLATLSYQMVEARHRAAETQRQLELVEESYRLAKQAVDDSFTRVVSDEALLNEPGLQPLRKRLLETALTYYQGFLRQRPDDPTRRADMAEMHFRVGYITAQIGSKAAALAEYQRARDLYEELLGANLADLRLRGHLATVYDNLGVVQADLGRPGDALRSYERGRDLRKELADENPADSQRRNLLAQSYNNLGNLQRDADQVDAALRSYEAARTLRQKLVQENPDNLVYQADLSETCASVGVLYLHAGRPAEALRAHTEARGLREKLVRDRPTSIPWQRDLARTYSNIGELHIRAGRLAEAVGPCESARDLLEKLVRDNPAVTQYQQDLAACYGNLGVVQHRLGQSAQAVRSVERARDLLAKLAQDQPNRPELQSDLSKCYLNLGALQHHAGEADAALQAYNQALAIRRKLAALMPPVPQYQNDLARTLVNVGDLQRDAGKPDEAVRSYEEARQIQDKLAAAHAAVPQYPIDLAITYLNLADVHSGAGREAEARRCYQQALDLQRRVLAAAPELAQSQGFMNSHYTALARFHRHLGQPAEAVAAILKRQELWPTNPVELYNVACDLALCIPLVGRGKPALSAEEEAQRRRYADEAMGVLRRAVARGFKDGAHMRADSDLEPLRMRDDFQKLVAELQGKAKAPAK
jgi:serine/threonine-protein kinase